MNSPSNLRFSSDDNYIIHSTTLSYNYAKNSTRLSSDHKNQMLIKGIYKLPEKTPKTNLTIYQTSLSTNERTFPSSNKIMKTEETPQSFDKYPFRMGEIIKEKMADLLNPSPRKEEIEKKEAFQKPRFFSIDMKTSQNNLQENPIEKKQFFLYTAYKPKKNWFAYPKNANLKNQNQSNKIILNSSAFQMNMHNSNSISQSIVSSPKKRKISSIKSVANKTRPSTQKPRPSLQKPRVSYQKEKKDVPKESFSIGLLQAAALSGQVHPHFERKYIENLNELVKNPIEPLPMISMNIKQTDLKNEGLLKH